ncbi:hypothetical protein [Rubrolithibacter danxiaensis]|uniref:hypothetical protein n=1 Tax=Rubrolithibacter danxiaensis TaxID=3390805 RepID=UPI003BF824EE
MKSNQLLFLLLTVFLFSCKKEKETVPPKSSLKEVKSIKFPYLKTQVYLTYTTDTIVATFLKGEVLDTITPLIGISPKAIISPASGIRQNFNVPVTYTITAEDGSSRKFTLKPSFDESTLVVDTLAKKSYFLGDTLEITGFNLGTDTTTTKVDIIAASSISAKAELIEVTPKRIKLKIPYSLLDNMADSLDVHLKIIKGSNGETKILKDILHVKYPPTPHFIEFYVFNKGKDPIRIYGKNFAANKSKIKIRIKDRNSDWINLRTDTIFSYIGNKVAGYSYHQEWLVLKFPDFMEVKNQTFTEVEFSVNGKAIRHLVNYQREITIPKISSIYEDKMLDMYKNKFFWGQTLVLRGEYLKDEEPTFLIFSPKKGGADIIFPVKLSEFDHSIIKQGITSKLQPGNYTVKVYKNNHYSVEDKQIAIYNNPYISRISGISQDEYYGSLFKKGTRILIEYNNFGVKAGSIVNVNFVPVSGGISYVRTATVRGDLLSAEVDIPNELATGKYTISLENNFKYTEEAEIDIYD